MLDAFYPSIFLAFESGHVVQLRLVRLVWGGSAAVVEAQLMVIEKVAAAVEAGVILMTGGSPERVIARYREHVAANRVRLAAD